MLNAKRVIDPPFANAFQDGMAEEFVVGCEVLGLGDEVGVREPAWPGLHPSRNGDSGVQVRLMTSPS